MTPFDILTLIGGLSLFLFGMNFMGDALERRAGSKLKLLLGKITTNKAAGLLTGLGVTAVIQSSSATTVMVVGFVNSGLMTLRQAINVIMGANIGTTVTAWILSLSGIDGGAWYIRMFKPTSFTPILALIGIIFYMFFKSDKKRDTGSILLGFAVLMFGMDIMSSAVGGLADVPGFTRLFTIFTNPILGVLAGAVLTAVIQSSSASVGILQALAASTNGVSYGAAIPIIMGQNIGTCVTAMLSSVGTNKNARRAALVHLSFNVIGTLILLVVFSVVRAMLRPAFLSYNTDAFSIAVVHSIFNILCTLILLPASGLLERLAMRLVPETREPERVEELDQRLLNTPAVAIDRSRALAFKMAENAASSIKNSLALLQEYNAQRAAEIRAAEEKTDHYEDIIGSYLVQLSGHNIGADESDEANKLLRLIGDFERIADHSVNLLDSAEELRKKGITLSPLALKELSVISAAVEEIVGLSFAAFTQNSIATAHYVEPLEQVIDQLKETLKKRHIKRMQQGECGIEIGFIWSDLLTDLERVADHCSNIAGCVIDIAQSNMNIHETLRAARNGDGNFARRFSAYSEKYALP